MRDPGDNSIKAWAKEYEEAPFFFEHDAKVGKRLVAWSEEPDQIKKALYRLLDNLPANIDILLKISAGDKVEGKSQWSRFVGQVERWRLTQIIQQNEMYVFSDGMHQLCLKDPNSNHYLAFDEHGIFFIYSPMPADVEVFRSLGFESRYAEPIYSIPHFQHTLPNSETLEMKLVAELGLERANSDLD